MKYILMTIIALLAIILPGVVAYVLSLDPISAVLLGAVFGVGGANILSRVLAQRHFSIT